MFYTMCSCGHRYPHQQAGLTSGGRNLVGNVNRLLPRRYLQGRHRLTRVSKCSMLDASITRCL